MEPDRLWECGADLFADYAVNVHRPGQAPSPVVKGSADLERLLSGTLSKFFIKGQRIDGSGRAHATAEHTVVLAVADTIDQDRAPDPLEPGLQQGRLDRVSRTDLHTFPALDAPSEKVLFGDRTGRPDHAILR